MSKVLPKALARKADYPVAEVIIQRWSPRALSGESISDKELFSLFEAARWAPSSYNNQPWRFIYAHRNTPSWDRLFNLMTEGNKSWARNAAVLIVIASHNVFDYNGKPSRTHSFDTGSAWAYFALQASMNGLVAHGMEGFDYVRAHKDLLVPDEYTIEAMCAVGKPGELQALSPEQQKTEKPSTRKPLHQFVFEGTYKP